MKPLNITLGVVLYFLGSVVYMLVSPESSRSCSSVSYVWLRTFYYILQYGLILFLAINIRKHTYNSVDLLSLLFLIVYSIGKLVFFVFLINKDMPIYIKFLDSKTISIIYSIFLLCLTIMINLIRR